MYSLHVIGTKCVISDYSKGAFCFYRFDMTQDIFDLDNNENGLIAYLLDTNPEDNTISDAKNFVHRICYEDYSLHDIECSMGSYHVPFPVFCEDDESMYCKCDNAICIVLSAIRFLYIDQYKFTHCMHCGKLLCYKRSRSTSRKKYCDRKSPCILGERYNYTHLNCEQAVRNANQQLSRMKKKCYNADYTRKESSLNASYNQFLGECDNYSTNQPTVQNLQKYYYFLQNELQKRGIKV